ncbi:MAG: autotransporter-associated beta strand repeat-containing protein [Bacteroidales bacterium]|nr:autotransporter-associated beta strand repeat-containing protein [Bacteroidales bacterium]MCF8457790.1 autotransporter-associated beta strand repeat-containing protein [Bacteroidales bacterium]
MKKIPLLLVLCYWGVLSISAQTTFSWRSEASDGDWQQSGNWWDGTSSTNIPLGSEVLTFANDAYTSMTNDLSSTNRYRLYFNSGCTQSRTITGSTENTFYEYNFNIPKIENNSYVSHTISFPIKNGYVGGMEINPINGDLTILGTYNTNGNSTIIYGAGSKLLTFGGVVSGSGSFVIIQYSKVMISANSTVSGSFAIDEGELWFNENGALGGGTIFVGNGGMTTITAKVWLYDQDGGTTCDEPIVINNANSSIKRVIGGLHTSNTNTFSGSITLNGPLTIETQSSSAITEFSGVISNNQLIVSKGPGTNLLSAENTWTGNLYVVSGALELTNTTDPLDCPNVYLGETFGSDDATLQIGASSVTVDNNIEVRSGSSGTKYLKYTPTNGSGEFSGTLALSSDVTVEVAGSSILTQSGIISGGNSLTKTGTGTLVLTADNTYTGTTTVSAGILELQGDVNSGTIIVQSGATLRINAEDVSIFTLTINSGGVVEILPGKSLTSASLVTNNAGNSGIIIRSDASGNGSLIYSDSEVPGTIERYIPGYTGSNDGWHLLSSPVSIFEIANSDFEPDTNDDLYVFDESSNQWLNYKVPGNSIDDFIQGEGYLVAYETTTTKEFTGTMNYSSITFDDLSVGSGSGWQLLGNPFPCAIQWNTPSVDWAITDFGGVAKVLNVSNGNYLDINAGNIIPSTNGFFVQAANSTNTITIPSSARTHSTTNNYKTTTPNKLTVSVTNNANSYADITNIGIKQDASMDFDWAFDSHKLFGWETAPQLWTAMGNEIYSTNYLAPLQTSYSLPLNFHAGVNSTYHLAFEGISSFDANLNIVLEDVLTNTLIDLTSQNNYSFQASTADIDERFVLHFNMVNENNELQIDEKIQIFASEDQVQVLNKTGETGKFSILNTNGQLVFNKHLTSQTSQVFSIQLASGIYLIQATAGSENKNNKLFIR